MNEPGTTPTGDAPTAEQTALLQYLQVLPAEPTTRAQAGALIDLIEAAPDWQPHLQAWHRDKFRLHPELFAVPPRPYREARWWQSQITEGSLHGYNFRQPSVNQTLVILESLDRQAPGWDRESKRRRTHRFMNELAALSPELCKPGCSFPHELPPDGDDSEETPAAAPAPLAALTPPAAPPLRAPSAPFVPNAYRATTPFPTASDPPEWQPPVQPPVQNAAVRQSVPERKSHAPWWALGTLCLAAGVGAYGYFGYQSSAPVRNDAPASSIINLDNPGGPAKQSAVVLPVLVALDSQKRAMERYPDLARGGSPLNQKFVALVHKLEVERSPRLQQPDWPEQLANECAMTLAIAPVIPKATPTPAPASSVPGTVPAPAPSARQTSLPAPAPAGQPVEAAAPPVPMPPRAAAPAAAPPLPANRIFVTLDAVNKSSANHYRYNWLSAYGYYDLSFRQSVGIDVKVRNMMRDGIPMTLRWAFFARRNAPEERYILAAAQKRLDLAPGQTIADAIDSPLIQGRSGTYYDYGLRYYAGSRYEGWLVQLLPEGGHEVIKQVGSTSYIEDFAKRSDFEDLLKQRMKMPNNPP